MSSSGEDAAVDDETYVLKLGALKRDIGEALNERWAHIWPGLLKRQYGSPVVADETELFDFFDRFFNLYELPDGRTPIEVYADEEKELGEEVRGTLRSWRNAVESVFLITGMNGWLFHLAELETGQLFLVRPNKKLSPNPFRVGMYIRARLVPVRKFFSFSGVQEMIAPADANKALSDLKVAIQRQLEVWKRRRWQPSPGESCPNGHEPCPCGSGRRYKKCCMRR